MPRHGLLTLDRYELMPWVEGESIATRPRCANCGEYVVCDFRATDDVWRRAVPRQLQNGYLCLTCFAKSGDERLVKWEEGLELFPTSLHTQLAVNRTWQSRNPEKTST